MIFVGMREPHVLGSDFCRYFVQCMKIVQIGSMILTKEVACLIVSFSPVPAVCLPPGTIHASNFSKSRIAARYAKAGQYEKTMELFR
jgi:hypothetical protein